MPETFHVKKGQKYRFRVICASMAFAFRISVDRHMLHVIASDGSDVITKTVESVIVGSGERYDFWIEASDPVGEGLYWIRAETLEYYQNEKVGLVCLFAGSRTITLRIFKRRFKGL